MAMMASLDRTTIPAWHRRAERALRFFHWLWSRPVPGAGGAVETSVGGRAASVKGARAVSEAEKGKQMIVCPGKEFLTVEPLTQHDAHVRQLGIGVGWLDVGVAEGANECD